MSKDDARLLDMVTAAQRITEYIAGRSLDDFRRNNMLQDAVIRQLMVIGEAARAVSEVARSRFPSVPWRQISAARNIFVHEYARIDLETVWNIAAHDIKELKTALAGIVPPENKA